MQEFLLVIHILAAGAWIGTNFVQIATTRRVIAQGGQPAATWMSSVVYWGRVIYTPAAIVILATGIGMVLNSSLYEFSSTFVSIGFLAVILTAALGMTVFAKGGKQAAAAFSSGDDDGGRAAAMGTMRWGILDSLVLLVALFAMVYKWGV
jgi:hypothetical protein